MRGTSTSIVGRAAPEIKTRAQGGGKRVLVGRFVRAGGARGAQDLAGGRRLQVAVAPGRVVQPARLTLHFLPRALERGALGLSVEGRAGHLRVQVQKLLRTVDIAPRVD